MNLYIVIAIIAVVLVVAFFVFKISSENKAKKNYTPPVPAAKTTLPNVEEVTLPAKSENRLHFCKKCGSANSDKDVFCRNCGKML